MYVVMGKQAVSQEHGLLLQLLILSVVHVAYSQNEFNLTLAPGDEQTRLIDPNNNNDTLLTVTLVWDNVTVDDVLGRLDDDELGSLNVSISNTSQMATVTIDTAGWKEGRYKLLLTAVASDAEASLLVVIFLQEPINSLEIDDLGFAESTFMIFETFYLFPSSEYASSGSVPLPDGSLELCVFSKKDLRAAALCAWQDSEEMAYAIPNDFPLKKRFTFQDSGNYTLTFTCRNTLSRIQLPFELVVEGWEMEDFVIISSDYQIVNSADPTEKFPFRLGLKDFRSPPSDINASFTYGDGSEVDSFQLNSLDHKYMYVKRGVYSGKVILSHRDKGSVTRNFTVWVGAIQVHLNTRIGLVENQTFVFNTSFARPLKGPLKVNFGYGIPESFTGSDSITVPHTYNAVGYYTVTFSADNPFSETFNLSEIIEVEGPANQDLKLLVDDETFLIPTGDMNVSVLLDRPIHRILQMNCSFDFNEVQDPFVRHWNGSLNVNESFTVPFQYFTLGLHDIIVNCTNGVSKYFLQTFVFAYHACFSDDPIFDPQYRLNNPMVVPSSDSLRLVTRTIVYCASPGFQWTVHKVTSGGTFEPIDIVTPDVDYIEFKPGSLAPAVYRIRANMSFGPENNYTWLLGATYVKIIPSPLVAEIAGGSVIMTNNPQAEIDGLSLSYDPVYGLDNKTDLQFSWSCQRLSSTDFEQLLALSDKRLPANLSDCNDISAEVGLGRRQLRVGGDVAAAGYLFQLAVHKEADMSEPARLFLQYQKDSFTIELTCVLNCEKNVITTSQMILSVVCSVCSYSELALTTYHWSLFLNNTGRFDEDLLTSETLSGFKQSVAVAGNILTPCRSYRIVVRMTSSSGVKAAAARNFVTNCIPTGGNCTVEPKKGNETTRFRLSCPGWRDGNSAESTDSKPLYYKYFLRGDGITVPVAESGQSTMPRVELPLIAGLENGTYELIARIYDLVQDYAEVSTNISLTFNLSSDQDIFNGDYLHYWKEQIAYAERWSTLEKQLRGMSTASGLLGKVKIPEDSDTLQLSRDEQAEWDDQWHTLNNPEPNILKENLTEMIERFVQLIRDKHNAASSLSGLGVAALGEGLASVLNNPQTTSLQAVEKADRHVSLLKLKSSESADRGAEALRKLLNTKPFPVSAKLDEAVFSFIGLVDNIIAASIPSYDLSVGPDVLFNDSDEFRFVVQRTKLAQRVSDLQKIDTTRTAMIRLTDVLNTMHDSLLTGVVLGQEPLEMSRDDVTLMVSKMTSRGLTTSTLSAAKGSVDLLLDLVGEDETENDADAPVDIKTTVFNKNPYAWSSDMSSYEITSPVVSLQMQASNGTKKLRKLTVHLKRGRTTPVPVLDTFDSRDTRSGPDGWFYHPMTLRSGSSAVAASFRLPIGFSQVVAYFRTARPPTSSRYDVRTEGQLVKASEVRRKRASTVIEEVDAYDSSIYQFFVHPGYLSPGIVFVGFYLPELDANSSVQYGYSAFSDMCRVWNEAKQVWDTTSCTVQTVSQLSRPEETVCTCVDPPGLSFGSSFFVAPNTIDFNTVFLKFDVSNASVYVTLIALFILWLLALLWARRKDKQDKLQWMVGYLTDNHVNDSHFYLMTVYTGLSTGAGTKSNVRFVLNGEADKTRVRMLTDGKRVLSRGSVLSYVLATSKDLGPLEYLRIWHDDSGDGIEASWYLIRVTVEDLHNGELYNFICDRWLARDKEDGLIDRLIPSTKKEADLPFNRRFSERTRIEACDSHLWLSCVLRPERSSFTRRQRISCCFVLLLLTMITSALFYQAEDNETGESTNKLGLEVTIGPLRFSLTTLWTSTVSILITTLPMLVFVVLFKSYRPRPGSRVTYHKGQKANVAVVTMLKKLTKQSEQEDVEAVEVQGRKNRPKDDDLNNTNCGTKGIFPSKEEAKDQTADAGKTNVGDVAANLSDLLQNALQQNPLPHFWLYIAWALLLATIVGCSFFLLLYSMQWGSTTSAEWLASFFLSFFESFLFVDPIKMLMLAFLLVFFASNPFSSTLYQYVDLQRVQREVACYGTQTIDDDAKPPKPVSRKTLNAARTRRQQEELARRVFLELIFYAIFIFCVFCISISNRDLHEFRTNQHLENMFYSKEGHAPFAFESISSRDDVVLFINQTIRSSAFPWTDMLGQELSWQQRFYTADNVSFRLGPVRVRQVRMPQRNSTVLADSYARLQKLGLYPPYDQETEERGSYCLGWKPARCSDEEALSTYSISSWQHVTDVLPVSIWGTFAWYPSGGYVADFVVNRDVIIKLAQELQEWQWLDLQTRAVFVELAVYNPNTNLFTFMRMAVEFPEVGASTIWRDMRTLRLYQHQGALGIYFFLCELLALLFTVIFTCKAIYKIKSQRCQYFRDVWQMLDFITLLWAYAALIFYVLKMFSVTKVMALWRHDPKVYVDFYLPVLWDTIYGYILAALLFVLFIRLLRILGYNQRITMLATVLARSGRALCGYSAIFFVVISAYASAGHVCFCSSMRQFRSIWDTYVSLYVMLLGSDRLAKWIQESPLWAQVYFLSLTVLVVFILYTMFEAIMCNTTEEVKAEVSKIPPPYGLTGVVGKMYRTVVTDWIIGSLFRGKGIGPAVKKEAREDISSMTKDLCHSFGQDEVAKQEPHKEGSGDHIPWTPLPTDFDAGKDLDIAMIILFLKTELEKALKAMEPKKTSKKEEETMAVPVQLEPRKPVRTMATFQPSSRKKKKQIFYTAEY